MADGTEFELNQDGTVWVPLRGKSETERTVGGRYRKVVIVGRALIDQSDLDSVKLWTWHTREGYAFANIKVNGKWTVKSMQKLLLNPEGTAKVDHINGNRLDNRRSNLRIVTNQQNAWNRAKPVSGLSSRYKGVSYNKERGKWRAQMTVGGKKIYLGDFSDEESAALAYDTQARLIHQEFGSYNFPQEGERQA